MGNVCFLFGVNGVGKSTMARMILARVSGAIGISASEAMRAAFGGISREELERLDPVVKHEEKKRVLLQEFSLYREAPLIVCDTHLTVPIRRDGAVQYERMWDEAYSPFAKSFLYLTAPTPVIVARRMIDMECSGRVRNVSPRSVAEDVAMDHEEFLRLFTGRRNAKTVDTTRPYAPLSVPMPYAI